MKPTILTLDYETYFNRKDKYSIRVLGNEQYILDRRFQAHGCAISVNYQPAVWYTKPELKKFLASIDPKRCIMISHNILFDAAITLWRFGVEFQGYADTMGLAHAYIRPYTGSSALKACAEHEGLAEKRTDVLEQCHGLRTHEIQQFQGLYEALGEYGCADADKCVYLFKKYYPRLSQAERVRMDWSVRNYLHGRLRIDMKLLHEVYVNAEKTQDDLCREAGIDKKLARSRPKFAEYLKSLGVEVEYKRGKGDIEIPAIAKNDPFVIDLLESGKPDVVAAMRARLACASTIEVSRAKRLLAMGHVTKGKMLLPTVWHAAHTGRPGGTDKVNPTNFKKRTKNDHNKLLLRDVIVPPIKHCLLDVDASQIEARLCAWYAQCQPLLDAFSDAERDVYCEVATMLFGHEVTPDMDFERQVGKVTALSAQYGVGWLKTMRRLQAIGIDVGEHNARRYIKAYREGYPEILGNGFEFIDLLRTCVSRGVEIEWKGCLLTSKGIKLPSDGDRWLRYPELRLDGRGLTFFSARYKSWQSLHAGYVNENLCQAGVHDHLAKTHEKWADDIIMSIYDNVMMLLPEERFDAMAPAVVKDMSTPSPWMYKVHDTPPPLSAKASPPKYHW